MSDASCLLSMGPPLETPFCELCAQLLRSCSYAQSLIQWEAWQLCGQEPHMLIYFHYDFAEWPWIRQTLHVHDIQVLSPKHKGPGSLRVSLLLPSFRDVMQLFLLELFKVGMRLPGCIFLNKSNFQDVSAWPDFASISLIAVIFWCSAHGIKGSIM